MITISKYPYHIKYVTDSYKGLSQYGLIWSHKPNYIFISDDINWPLVYSYNKT